MKFIKALRKVRTITDANLHKMTDWYRRKTWTKADEEEFLAKLGRARKTGRSQYLRIQAITLIDTRKKNLLPVAEMLLNKVLTDYPEDRTEISMTYCSLGSIFQIKGDFDRALAYFRKSIDFERTFPNVRTGSHISFAEVVVHAGKTELYEEAEQLLLTEINADGMKWPSQNYRMYSLLSVILRFRGDDEQAALCAELAEANANAKTNTLWNPQKRKLGIVENTIGWLDKLVRQ